MYLIHCFKELKLIMKKYLLLYILILMVPFAASAQRKNLYEKMSATTMMLMNDLQEDEEENKAFAKNVANAKLRIKDKKPKVSERFARGKHRTYAAPDTIDGKAYISSSPVPSSRHRRKCGQPAS